MKNIIYLLIALIFIGCQEEVEEIQAVENQEAELELIALRNQLAQLTLESQLKDSVFNQSIAFFNEIQENLAKISIKEDLIRIKSANPEITNDEKEWVIQEIQNINYLREQNAKKVRDLQGQIHNLQGQSKEQAFKITELELLVTRLNLQIKSRDEKIESLQNQLSDLDVEYSELFDQYHEQVELALGVLKELNTVYFAYGTIEELENNNVLVREGGFIGIGKKTAIAEELNQKYFKKLDKNKIKELTVVGKKPQLITDHPSNSYEWNGNKLKILDPSNFWRISNYLVVVVK